MLMLNKKQIFGFVLCAIFVSTPVWANYLGDFLKAGIDVSGNTHNYASGKNIKLTSGYFDLGEISAPDNPATDRGRLYVKDVANTTTLMFKDSSGSETNLLTGTSFTTGVEFEGATADDFVTLLAVEDPTANRTATLPNASGTIMLSTLSTNAPDAANSVYGASNSLVFEGATANNYETSMTVVDPTADRTITLPNSSGTVVLSTLSTNAADAANSVWLASNGIVFEGVKADGNEITLTPADPTADRTITLPNLSGTLVLDVAPITAKTEGDSPVTLTTSSSGGVYTNKDASGGLVYNLPTATSMLGKKVTFVVLAGQNLDINPDNTDTILGLTNSAGDAIRSSAIGDTITLLAVDTNSWTAIGVYGTWSDIGLI